MMMMLLLRWVFRLFCCGCCCCRRRRCLLLLLHLPSLPPRLATLHSFAAFSRTPNTKTVARTQRTHTSHATHARIAARTHRLFASCGSTSVSLCTSSVPSPVSATLRLWASTCAPRPSCRRTLSAWSTKSTQMRKIGRRNRSASAGVDWCARKPCIILSYSSRVTSACTGVRGKPSTTTPVRYTGSSSCASSSWMTSRSPTRPPAALTTFISSVWSRSLTTMGGAVSPRSRMI